MIAALCSCIKKIILIDNGSLDDDDQETGSSIEVPHI